MKVSDEQLSAFLDAELTAEEMEWVRQQLMDDEELANRLAELAMVDEQIATHYASIDQVPMPESVSCLLMPQLTPQPQTAQIIAFPLRKKLQKIFQPQVAAAACAALVIVGSIQFFSGKQQDNWSAVAQVLDTQISGNTKTLDDGSHVKPRLTFLNRDGDYCRQFQISNQQQSSENIACRRNNQWELQISLEQKTTAAEDYQTASGGSVLDATLDDLMQGEVFDASAEENAIANAWHSHQ